MYPPFRIKITERLPVVSRKQRYAALQRAGFNPFAIPANTITVDLISDSGTGAMSIEQWQALFRASEDFSGQQAYNDFVRTARWLFGMRYVQPVHQGRAAENLLFHLLLRPGDIAVSNTHFETTRDNIESLGCRAIDLPCFARPYCGDMSIKRLTTLLHSAQAVRCIILTITSNIRGGQPVSFRNMRQIKTAVRRYNIPVIFDASRFADNAYFLQQHTSRTASIHRICRRMFSCADIIYLSCKKSALANVGGCITMRSRSLYEKLIAAVLQRESYPTSGGLAARDLAAMTQGLREAIDQTYLHAHSDQIQYLARALRNQHVPIKTPIGRHAIAIPPRKDRSCGAFSLAARVYLDSGIRGGIFDDLYRLALPRRVYVREHLDYVARSLGRVYNKPQLRLRPLNDPVKYRNFLIRFKTY